MSEGCGLPDPSEAAGTGSGKGKRKKKKGGLDITGGGVGAAREEKGQRLSPARQAKENGRSHGQWLFCGTQALCVSLTDT